jgi:hypothetical protein
LARSVIRDVLALSCKRQRETAQRPTDGDYQLQWLIGQLHRVQSGLCSKVRQGSKGSHPFDEIDEHSPGVFGFEV